jgi:glycine cleavage system H protein
MNDLRHHLKYTPDHLWISVEGTSATVGLTAWAVEELGEIEAVRFPPSENIPESLEAGECVAVIECDNGELDICLPLSGSNFETNAILAEDPNVNLMVYGDFNDTRDEAPVRTIQGKAKTPAHLTSLYLKDRMGMSWTHYWEWAGLYSRIDFIFVNAGLHSEIDFENCRIPWRDDWEQGSDHRPLLATIFSRDR